MKQLIGLLSLFILMACGHGKHTDDRRMIDLSKVDFIKICRQVDAAQNCKLFNNEQANLFVKKWNKAKLDGPYKLNPKYVIEITFKDNEKRIFRINGKYIDEQGSGWCFDLGDSTYIEQVWTNTK